MKPKNLSLIAVLMCAGMTLTMFQNCSKVAVSDNGAVALSKTGDNVATATDAQGAEVPVAVGPATEVILPDADSLPPALPPVVVSDDSQPDDSKSDDGAVIPTPAPAPGPVADSDDQQTGDQNDTTVEPEASPSDLQAACGLDLKTIHNVVDLAQFAGQDVNLDLLKGKTLVYSSDSSIELKSLNIDVAVGRTILCGCKVDKLNIKKGRLEVYHSEIKEVGQRSGKLIHDSASVLPAGI